MMVVADVTRPGVAIKWRSWLAGGHLASALLACYVASGRFYDSHHATKGYLLRGFLQQWWQEGCLPGA